MIPILVAHRGYMEKYPENTLSAIRAALECGACLVEFDIQMDANRKLMLLHDDDFKRTANIPTSIFEQLDSSRVSVHEPDRFADTFFPEPVPSLVQVINLLQQFPESTAFVEVKEESLQHWGIEPVMDLLLNDIEPARQQCVIIADNLDALLYARDAAGCRIGWVIHRYDDDIYTLAEQHAPDFMICNYRRIKDQLWQGSWQWMLYDISDPELAIEWANKGAELIETRDIGDMLQHSLLQQRACHRYRKNNAS